MPQCDGFILKVFLVLRLAIAFYFHFDIEAFALWKEYYQVGYSCQYAFCFEALCFTNVATASIRDGVYNELRVLVSKPAYASGL